MFLRHTESHASRQFMYAFIHAGEWHVHDRMTLVWSEYALSNIIANEHLIENAYNTLFADNKAIRDDMHIASNNMLYNTFDMNAELYAISHHYLRDAFNKMLMQCDEVPSGDDTSFDYYPSLVCFTYQIACDLRDHLNDATALEELRNVIADVKRRWDLEEHNISFNDEVINIDTLT